MKLFGLTLATCLLASTAQAAESIDGSLDEMATQIVQRTTGSGGSNVGISTFTHSDGTCSQLSNYISEFIVDSLFNAGQGQIDIIERSQLSAIFREMELVYDATIAPDTAKKLGEIAGVDALVTGSLIEFGEVVKVQARLISTADGKLFATARSDFPMVGTIGQMMAERSRAACGFTDAKGAPVQAPAATTTSHTQAVSAGGVKPATDSARVYASDVFVAELSSMIYSKNSGNMTVALRFQNTSEQPIGLAYYDKTLNVTDGQGGVMELEGTLTGMRVCNNSLGYCTPKYPQYVTVLPPGKIGQYNFSLKGADKLEQPVFTMAMEVVVTPNAEETSTYDVRSINFLDVTPTVR
ncbi:MAG: FlgO family outer membrane protein [Pseudomonadota bacterium]